MPTFTTSTAVLTLAILLLLARPAHAFGAGNIASVAKIEGLNCEYASLKLCGARTAANGIQGAMEISKTPSLHLLCQELPAERSLTR
jgi:hypothetical protein